MVMLISSHEVQQSVMHSSTVSVVSDVDCSVSGKPTANSSSKDVRLGAFFQCSGREHSLLIICGFVTTFQVETLTLVLLLDESSVSGGKARG